MLRLSVVRRPHQSVCVPVESTGAFEATCFKEDLQGSRSTSGFWPPRFCSWPWAVLSPETLGSFLFSQQAHYLHLLLFHTLFFFLSSFFTKTWNRHFLPHHSVSLSFDFYVRQEFLDWDPVFARGAGHVCAHTDRKQISLKLSLSIVTTHDILWSVQFFFL